MHRYAWTVPERIAEPSKLSRSWTVLACAVKPSRACFPNQVGLSR